MKRLPVILIALLLVFSNITNAQETEPINIGTGAILDQSIAVEDPDFGLVSTPVSAKLYVKFYVKDKQYEVYDFDQMNLSFDLRVSEGGEDRLNQVITLNISKYEPEQWMVYDFISDDVAGYNFYLSNIVLSKNEAPTQLNQHIMLQAVVAVDYNISVIPVQLPSLKQELAIYKVADNEGSRSRTLRWNNNNKRYPAYQVQVLKLYNTKPNNTNPEAIQAFIEEKDWAKALTLEVYDNGSISADKELALSLIEGTGYYAWRVRPLGNYGKGLTSDPRNLGLWSPGTEYIDITSKDQIATDNRFFYFQDPEENKNWSYTRVFSEKEKMKDIIQFANGLNYVQQTQTHLYSSDVTLVTQAVVDYTGRTCINTMPVPIAGKTLDTYETDFFRSSGNEIYTAKNFDTESKYNNPDKNYESNSFRYYNGNNLDLVPDAGQYAFSRVVYYNDGTGRIKEQTGVGPTHHKGDGTGGKTTRFYYTSPTDLELITLFGNEAPSLQSVIKITTIDPNGVASVQYKGKDGKLLATAIQEKEDAEPTLEKLNYPGQTNTLDVNINKLSISSKDGFVVSKRFVLTHQVADFHILYTPPATFFGSTVGCYGGNCSYQLSIIIYDLENEEIKYSETKTITQGSGGIDDHITLPDGEYLVVKKLLLNLEANNFGFLSANGLADKLRPVIDIIKLWLNQNVATGEWTLQEFYDQVDNIPSSINIPEYQTYFQKLVDDAIIPAFPDPNLMSNLGLVDASIILDQDNQPKQLSIENTCGAPMLVNLKPDEPPFKCIENTESNEDQYFPVGIYSPATNEGLYDLEGYMWKQFGLNLDNEAAINQMNEFYINNLRGYNIGQFNKMVYHMLNDSYAEATVGGEAKIQYTCQQVWTSWVNTINILKNSQDGEDGIDLANGVDDESNDGGNTLNEQFDKNYKPKGFFKKLFKPVVKFILHKKMRKHSDRNRISTNIAMNLPYLFLNSTGYKFARIVDLAKLRENPMFDVLPGDEVDYYNSRVNSSYGMYITNSAQLPLVPHDFSYHASEEEHVMPFLKSPVFAFKYYEYYSEEIIFEIDPWIPPRIIYSDCPGCEEGLYYGLTDPEVCPIVWGVGKLYAGWNFADRDVFYNCLQNCPIPTEPDEYPEEDPIDDCANYDGAVMQAEAITECQSTIQSRYNEYKQALTSLFISKGYTIGGCESDSNVITYEYIEHLTTQLVGQTKQKYCKLDPEGFSCQITDEITSCIPISATKYLVIQIGYDAELEAMAKAMYGKIHLDLSIPPAECTNPVPDHIMHVENGNVLALPEE